MGEEWTAFIDCFCTKCKPKLDQIPNQAKWEKIWADTEFCTPRKENFNLCDFRQSLMEKQSKPEPSRNGEDLIDKMFKNAWNAQMKERSKNLKEPAIAIKIRTNETKI